MATPTHLTSVVLSLMLAVGAHAADSTGALGALKILTETTAEVSATEAPQRPVARQSLTLQRSETLDSVIHRQFPGTPFKDEVLRRALAELNPKTVPSAANNLLKRGSTLVLPTTEDLRQTLLQHYPSTAELVRVKVEVESEESAANKTAGADKRRWVRFP